MKRVLIVEDDPQNALVFRKTLERRGFEVAVTESGDEVVARVSSGATDLVLMDVSLPNTRLEGRSVNGIELCRALKDRPECRGVPVVLATAHAMRGDAESFLQDSVADGYVSKPVLDLAAFAAQIDSMIREAA